MGKKLLAQCSRCQFQKLVIWGSSKRNIDRIQQIPAMHMRTGAFGTVNLKDPMLIWEDYYFYTEAEKTGIADFCPNCGGNTLRFEVWAYFD